ncbi:1-aminocyclopropane-1-carboxylate deaminase/D-cysteine desulfhydrase [Seongchinamella sediminis]|uniref:1-aminocyclopropane-1-carboxylate deaminase/D-cysteine desulfhydrase n=1 Tax=Seongchinamella sediminis TaxID=2283635 RepID=UPI0013C3498E|nr:pyridoxal-phosphate dependent enzyme [Seongchinamella sediminis]
MQRIDIGAVHILRLDQSGGPAPGNKRFKLRYHLAAAKARGRKRILSFGGAWSNHLHALAAVGAELGLETIGIVRGGEHSTPMLEDARAWGMELVPVSREEYRRRADPNYIEALAARFGPCLVVPEGGGGAEGVRGCLDIAGMINQLERHWSRVVVAVGTGTTLAGLAAGLACADELLGVAALKGAPGLDAAVQQALDTAGLAARLPWRIDHDYHCGGFARSNAALRLFMQEFEQAQRVPLEPVYTGKALFAVHSLLASGQWSATEPVLVVHTGGLQGRRGYDWLDRGHLD